MEPFDRSVESIWHFEPIGRWGQRGVRILRRLGLVRAKIHRIEHHVGHIRNDAGEVELIRLLGDARAICARVKQERFAKNPLFEAMASQWATSKVVLHFDKLTERVVNVECLRIGLVEWMLRSHLKFGVEEGALFIERTQWFSYLAAYAHSRGITLRGYRCGSGLKEIVETWRRLFWTLGKRLPGMYKGVLGRLRRLATPAISAVSSDAANATGRSTASTIAIRYGYRKLSFDRAERSEFFWLEGSGISYSEVLLYDYFTEKPLDVETLKQISSRGIRLVGRGTGIAEWFPTAETFGVFAKTVLKLLWRFTTCGLRGRWVSLYYVRGLLALTVDYAYWYGFFSANRVRVNVGTLNGSVGQVLALDALNGISVAYQYSMSNITSPTTLLSAGEHVQFVFSPLFETLWRRIEAPVDRFVCTGFIYDSAIPAVRNLTRISEARKGLQENGARFIICFFDENSLDRWDLFHWDKDAADDYEYLLKWLLDDPSLGVVFKPKKSSNLFQRISRLSTLLAQAERTGRCLFLTSDTLVGSTYPAEAALISDLCLGWITGSTAAIEARLAGVPTVLIDPVGFHSHPFYSWGRGRIIFEGWESLRLAVEKFRDAPSSHPEFGDWTPGLHELDPFRDGQASVRLGLYTGWVYDALKQGASMESALSSAGERFAQRWGDSLAMRI